MKFILKEHELIDDKCLFHFFSLPASLTDFSVVPHLQPPGSDFAPSAPAVAHIWLKHCKKKGHINMLNTIKMSSVC